MGLQLLFQSVRSQSDLDMAFSTMAAQNAGALFVDGNPFFVSRRDQLIGLAARHALPTIYFEHEFPLVGGLMSYGPNFAEAYRQAGVYVGRILKGTKTADLPVLQPTSSILSSTSKPPRCSVSNFRRSCLRWPTR